MTPQQEDLQDFWKQVYVASVRSSIRQAITDRRLREQEATMEANAAVENYASAWGMKMPNLKK